jgi:hypothetical protein
MFAYLRLHELLHIGGRFWLRRTTHVPMVEVTVASGLISVVAGGGNMSIPADAIVSIRVHKKPVRVAAVLSPTNTDMGVVVSGAGTDEANGLYTVTGELNGLPVWTNSSLCYISSANPAPDYYWTLADESDLGLYLQTTIDTKPWLVDWEEDSGSLPVPAFSQATVNQTGYTNSDLWFVRIRLKDNTFEDFIMGEVSNQVTWVNTQAGANVAESDLDAVFA